MIRFAPPPKPADFDTIVRQPGQIWLQQNPDKEPKDFWSPIRRQLAEGFYNLCGYSVMIDLVGTVDHYLSCKNYPEQDYERENYRYASSWINNKKRNKDNKILDPFAVEDEWFEILLPSLQLEITDKVPAEEKERAKYTLDKLELRDGETII